MRTNRTMEQLDKAINFLAEQEKELKPLITFLQNLLLNKMTEDLTLEETVKIYVTLTEQYTNSVLLLTKVKEIMDAREN